MGPSTYRGFERQARHAAEAGVHEHQCRAHELLNLRGGDAAAAYALAQFPAFRASFDSCEPVLPLWHCAARGGQVCSATERQQQSAKPWPGPLNCSSKRSSRSKDCQTNYERHWASAIAATREAATLGEQKVLGPCRRAAATRDSGTQTQRSCSRNRSLAAPARRRATVSVCDDAWPAASRPRRWRPASSHRI